MRGITIQLVVKTQDGTDALNRPIFTNSIVEVENVLVGEPSGQEIINATSLYGRKAKYTLAIPKGDNNVWTDTEVILPSPFEGRYRTIGEPTAGIDSLIPLSWNKKVLIEKYGDTWETLPSN